MDDVLGHWQSSKGFEFLTFILPWLVTGHPRVQQAGTQICVLVATLQWSHQLKRSRQSSCTTAVEVEIIVLYVHDEGNAAWRYGLTW